MLDRKIAYSPLNEEASINVTLGLMFAYAHEKINILFSVLSIVSFPFYDFNLDTQGFVYLEFVKYQPGLHRNV